MIIQTDYNIAFFSTDKPGPPGRPVAEDVTAKSMTISWKPPIEDGGCEIDGYILEARVEGLFKWKKISDDIIPRTTYKV